MGIEQSYNFGPAAEESFVEFEKQKADRQLKKQERFDTVKVGDTLSFLDNAGKQMNDWQVKELHPETLEVTFHNADAAFSWDIKVPIDNVVSELVSK